MPVSVQKVPRTTFLKTEFLFRVDRGSVTSTGSGWTRRGARECLGLLEPRAGGDGRADCAPRRPTLGTSESAFTGALCIFQHLQAYLDLLLTALASPGHGSQPPAARQPWHPGQWQSGAWTLALGPPATDPAGQTAGSGNGQAGDVVARV